MKKILLIVLLLSLGFSHTTDLPSKVEIEMMTEEEKLLLYEEHRINPYNNMLWTGILPTSGHYRVHKWKRGFGIYLAGTVDFTDCLRNPWGLIIQIIPWAQNRTLIMMIILKD